LSQNGLQAREEVGYEVLPAEATAVPQNLLKLIHAPEVQQEMGLAGTQRSEFVRALADIDGPWWRARILPETKQREIVAAQEKLLVQLLEKTVAPDRLKRLHQIELQSQGTRLFARPDVAKAIGLSKTQSAKLSQAYAATDTVAKKMVGPKAQDSSLVEQLKLVKDAELKTVGEVLTEKQKMAFSNLVGDPFDTGKLSRIYPLAPELIDSGHWTGAPATTLAEHQGKVVLLHFYAFQCSNCIANFEHYKRWHRDLAEKGVVVIGIQTPETSLESDPKQVAKAAKDRGFAFPVLIDLEKRNWDAWSNTMWPTVYVIDKNGYIRHWWQGELNFNGATGDKTIETLVDTLIAEQ
jgi:peroxiredoxin